MSLDSYMTAFGPTDTVGYSFSYDHANRLTVAGFAALFPSPSSSWNRETSYSMPAISYYADGDMNTLQRDGSGSSLTDNLIYNYQSGTNRVTSISNSAGAGSSYTYDDNGNVISDSKDNISFEIYDIYNEPVEVYLGSGTVYTYGYEVNGTRILKNWGGSNWNFYMNDPDGKTIAINLGPTSSSVDYNVWAGNDNFAQVRYVEYGGYSYYYYLKNHLGNIQMVLDSSGAVDSYNDYYPYGEQMPNRNYAGSADGRYKYTSKERDVETGLDYFGARYYDSWRGQWLSVDPLANKYPGWSAYNYATDNPILFVDPNGADLSNFYDENGNLTHHENDGSNADYQVKGQGAHKHYEFTGFDEKQGGQDVIKLGSLIQEAQNLNMANPDVQGRPNGDSFCNFATQNILNSVGSALGINLDFPGTVSKMEKEIVQSGYFRGTDEATAAANAVGSLSLVIHLGDKEHIASFSTGANVARGLIANIGPARYTGFKSMNEVIESSRSKEYFILELSKILYTQKEY